MKTKRTFITPKISSTWGTDPYGYHCGFRSVTFEERPAEDATFVLEHLSSSEEEPKKCNLHLNLTVLRKVCTHFPQEWMLDMHSTILTFFIVQEIDQTSSAQHLAFDFERIVYTTPAVVSETGAQLFQKGVIYIK